MGRSRTPTKILEVKVYGSWPLAKPKKRWIGMMIRDARKLVGTTRWKSLALDQKVWGKNQRRLG
jgi:hypothetical protein